MVSAVIIELFGSQIGRPSSPLVLQESEVAVPGSVESRPSDTCSKMTSTCGHIGESKPLSRLFLDEKSSQSKRPQNRASDCVGLSLCIICNPPAAPGRGWSKFQQQRRCDSFETLFVGFEVIRMVLLHLYSLNYLGWSPRQRWTLRQRLPPAHPRQQTPTKGE